MATERFLDRRLTEVEGLRGLAILLVLFHHFCGNSLYINKLIGVAPFMTWKEARQDSLMISFFSVGSFGVYLFFLISGFVIAYSMLKSSGLVTTNVSIGKKSLFFMLRRILRLTPALWLSFFIIFFAGYYSGFWGKERLPNILASMFYSHNMIYADLNSMNDVTWSLEVEMQFYILFMLLHIVLAHWLKGAKAWVYALYLPLLAVPLVWSSTRIELSILKPLPYFLSGILLCSVTQARNWILGASHIIFDFFGIASFAFMLYLYSQEMSHYIIFIPTVLFFICGFKGKFLSKLFSSRLMYFYGMISYSLYLLHNFLNYRMSGRLSAWLNGHDIGGNARLLIMIGAGLVVSTFVATVFYYTVEKTSIRLANKVR